MENYSTDISLSTTVDKVFNALTEEIPLWWTERFDGLANEEAAIFTVHFGLNIYKTIRVEELSPDSKITWKVNDSLIAVPGLKNQTEWIGTTIIWEITPEVNGAKLQLTHIGLSPDIECYEICAAGWQQFTHSLKSLVETGKGDPFEQETMA